MVTVKTTYTYHSISTANVCTIYARDTDTPNTCSYMKNGIEKEEEEEKSSHTVFVCAVDLTAIESRKEIKKKENKTAKKSTIHTEWHTEHTIQTHDRRAPTTSCSRLVMFVF